MISPWVMECASLGPVQKLAQFFDDDELATTELHELFDILFRREVRVVVVLRECCGDSVLAFGGDEQDGALQSGKHAEEQVEQDEGIRVPPGADENGIKNRPQDHENNERTDEYPAAHAVAHDIRCALANAQVRFLFLVPIKASFGHCVSVRLRTCADRYH